jgi:glutathione S-transferase
MPTLHHSTLHPTCRFVRLALAEAGVTFDLVEERPTDRREAFLELNPAGTVPVFVDDDGTAVVGGTAIMEYIDETRGIDMGSRRLFPANPAGRAEVRRLVDWFGLKFHDEVSNLLHHEKVTKRFLSGAAGSPDMSAIRAARANIRYHLKYIGFLMNTRAFLAGDWLTFADLAAAAELSTVDYFGDVPWDEDEVARTWYARIKSRPSFRPLLSDAIPGIPPQAHYADLDF